MVIVFVFTDISNDINTPSNLFDEICEGCVCLSLDAVTPPTTH